MGVPSMKALCLARHIKFYRKAADISNDAIQTVLLILQNENVFMCNDVKIVIDCTCNMAVFISL